LPPLPVGYPRARQILRQSKIMLSMTDVRIVLTTLDDSERARRLAHEIVELRLAACVNIVDRVHSIYRWRDGVDEADELLLIFKTSSERLPELKTKIEELHPYELPEMIVLDVKDGSVPI
jgi:periplasmic divalent cation tolerance protein